MTGLKPADGGRVSVRGKALVLIRVGSAVRDIHAGMMMLPPPAPVVFFSRRSTATSDAEQAILASYLAVSTGRKLSFVA